MTRRKEGLPDESMTVVKLLELGEKDRKEVIRGLEDPVLTEFKGLDSRKT